MPPTDSDTLRTQSQAHYDRYPFSFDQEEILYEKLYHRLMGDAILGIASSEAKILDIGSGSCRVARMVRESKQLQVISLDLSLATLRRATSHNSAPMVNGDNMHLPFRSNCADLVLSNGVIHHTPDPRASFNELARVTKPGGILVISVYNRYCWYNFVYRYIGAIVRALRKLIGDRGLRLTVFPLFHVSAVFMLSFSTRKRFILPLGTSWNLFHDQLTTPQCTFHTFEEICAWAKAANLECVEKREEAARQLLSFKLRKLGEK